MKTSGEDGQSGVVIRIGQSCDSADGERVGAISNGLGGVF
jgi:hypothetical protein